MKYFSCPQIDPHFRRLYSLAFISLSLVVIILITFWNIQYYDFVFDDALYVTDNIHVKTGITEDNILWALTTTDAGFWHPLTWLSLMLDSELYGLRARGFHWTNLLFHIFNTILLFVVLHQTTGNLYRSGFVAALFSIHPLHVESVAWIAQRKDVLSTFFWMLTMGMYIYYAKQPDFRKYCLVICTFILGLMSKPMLVTLPFVLLLLDYWPLNRLELPQSRNVITYLIIEKVPLVIISIVVSVVTFYAEKKAGAILTFESVPFDLRVMNAIVSYADYIKKMFWPQGLAAFYPYFGTLPLDKVLLSGLLLTVISLFAASQWRERPYFMVGWLWYMGTLVPVIGLVQVGSHAMADRYTYVPLIGLFIMLSWGAPDLLKRLPYQKVLLAIVSVMILFLLMICSLTQSQVWKNSITLFSHALNVTSKNYLAHSNMGVALMYQGEYENAAHHFREAIRIKPNHAIAHTNMGDALMIRGKPDEAIKHFREALKIRPDYSRAQRYLADALLRKGKCGDAISLYNKVLQVEPDNAGIYNNLGIALICQGKVNRAVYYFESALKIKPDFADARNNLIIVMNRISKP